ncbi:hypothetical protein [Streptomyces melanogenes]|uniref:hypothetical protein n=1 Tax=Streptomyces melanogenes TaxID=67326 RepID=UPI003789AD4F
MKIDLGQLNSAADKWEAMAGEFKKLEDRYKDRVQPVSLDGTWTGQASLFSRPNFATTRHEYASAQVEAKAVASLLRDAYAHFVDLKKRVEHVRQDAIDAGMKVSETGAVSFDFSKVSAAEANAVRHDPDLHSTEMAWSKHIEDAVRAVDDADQGLKTALEAAVVDVDLSDGNFNGFNGKASGDVEHYEAEAAAALASKVNDGKKLSPQEVARFESLMRDNSHDTVFSQTMLASLGPEGTLKFSNHLSDWSHSGSAADKSVYAGLQNGLATTLSTATRETNSPFYKEFREGLRKAGIQKYDLDAAGSKIAVGTGHGQQVRGYQSLVTLMQQGGDYSGQFLKDMADDIRTAEDKKRGGNPDLWDLRGDFSGKKDGGWFANDPLDGVLGLMAKDPATATGYLDPGPGHTNDALKYLLTERDWNHVDTSDWTGNVERTGKDTFDKDVRTGLGLALEAGTTGNHPGADGTPFGRHSVEQTRVMHDSVNYLDYGAADGKAGESKDHPRIGQADQLLGKDEYAALRAPLARALADYSPDVVDILDGDAPGGRAGEKGAYAHGDDSQIQNSRSSLLRMIRGVSESGDPSNFERVYQAQQGYMSQELLGKDFPNDLSVTNHSRKVGEVMGALNAVGGDVKMDVHDQKISDATAIRFYGYHLGGGAITGIPVIGDAAQRLVDVSLNDWLASVQAEQGSLNKEELSRGNDLAQDKLDKYFETWGKEHHVRPDLAQAAAGEAGQSYVSGRQIAYEALRSRT